MPINITYFLQKNKAIKFSSNFPLRLDYNFLYYIKLQENDDRVKSGELPGRTFILLKLIHQDDRLGNVSHGAAGIHAFLVDQAVGGLLA